MSSDSSYPTFQHYGTNAERLAFTPSPAAGTQPLYTWYETDTGQEYQYTTTWIPRGAGSGGVPIDATVSQTVQTNTGWVVPESLTIDAGVILEIAGGARVEITGPIGQKIAQVVSTLSTDVNTGTRRIPLDDTIPQNTEGDEYMTCTITPTNTTSTLVIDVRLQGSASTSASLAMALFQDSGPNALAATVGSTINGTSVLACASLLYTMTAGTTKATTFKIRAAVNSGTMTFNGFAAARLFGAIAKSSITITEVLA